MTRIYVARHGQSTWNLERRWAGHADVPLTDLGRQQARDAARALRDEQFARVTSSSLQRARETAAIVAQELGVELVAPVENFNERHYGEVSGLTSSEIAARWPAFMEKWRAGIPVEIPGGELWHHFLDRVLDGVEYLRNLEGMSLVIAHMGVLRAIETSAGRPRRRYDNLEGVWVDEDLELNGEPPVAGAEASG